MNSVAIFDRVKVAEVDAGEGRVLIDEVEELVLAPAAVDAVVLKSQSDQRFILLQAFNQKVESLSQIVQREVKVNDR